MVMIRAIRRLLSGATLGLHVHRDRAQNNAVPGLTPSIESDMVRANGREAAAFLLFSVFGFYFDLRYGGVLPYVVVLQIALYVGLNASLWTIVLSRLSMPFLAGLIVLQFFNTRINTSTGFRLGADGSVFYALAASPPILQWHASAGILSHTEEGQFPLALLPVSSFDGHRLEVAELASSILAAARGFGQQLDDQTILIVRCL
jgi:hypothetical protein